MARLPVLIRQNQVFELLLAGATHRQICEQLQISEDTCARDMQAIGEQAQALARERAGEILAVALARVEQAYRTAWEQYERSIEEERAWRAGELDYTVTVQESGDTAKGPYEKTRTSTVRPRLRANATRWFELAAQATRDLAELTGIKKTIIELSGPKGGAIPVAIEDALTRIYGGEDDE